MVFGCLVCVIIDIFYQGLGYVHAFEFFKVACVYGPSDSCGCDLEGFNFPSWCLDCFNMRVVFIFSSVYGLVNVYILWVNVNSITCMERWGAWSSALVPPLHLPLVGTLSRASSSSQVGFGRLLSRSWLWGHVAG